MTAPRMASHSASVRLTMGVAWPRKSASVCSGSKGLVSRTSKPAFRNVRNYSRRSQCLVCRGRAGLSQGRCRLLARRNVLRTCWHPGRRRASSHRRHRLAAGLRRSRCYRRRRMLPESSIRAMWPEICTRLILLRECSRSRIP